MRDSLCQMKTRHAQDEAARRLDHAAMKLRLGAETSKVLELACGDATSEEVGAMYGMSGKPPNGWALNSWTRLLGNLWPSMQGGMLRIVRWRS